jgi:hypothetical protein
MLTQSPQRMRGAAYPQDVFPTLFSYPLDLWKVRQYSFGVATARAASVKETVDVYRFACTQNAR